MPSKVCRQYISPPLPCWLYVSPMNLPCEGLLHVYQTVKSLNHHLVPAIHDDSFLWPRAPVRPQPLHPLVRDSRFSFRQNTDKCADRYSRTQPMGGLQSNGAFHSPQRRASSSYNSTTFMPTPSTTESIWSTLPAKTNRIKAKETSRPALNARFNLPLTMFQQRTPPGSQPPSSLRSKNNLFTPSPTKLSDQFIDHSARPTVIAKPLGGLRAFGPAVDAVKSKTYQPKLLETEPPRRQLPVFRISQLASSASDLSSSQKQHDSSISRMNTITVDDDWANAWKQDGRDSVDEEQEYREGNRALLNKFVYSGTRETEDRGGRGRAFEF